MSYMTSSEEWRIPVLVIDVEMAETTGSSGSGSTQLLPFSRLQELFMVFIISFETGVMPSLHSFWRSSSF